MRQFVQAHEFDSLSRVCVHCHVPEANVIKAGQDDKPISCVTRWVEGDAVEQRSSSPGHSVVDDADAIGARLAELRREQDAALARTTEESTSELDAPIYFVERRVVESREEFELRRIHTFDELRRNKGTET